MVYSKSELLSFRDSCTARPDDLPDRTIQVKKKPNQWRPRQGDNDNNNRKQWDRGVKQAPYKDKNRRRGRDNNNNRYNDQNLEDVPKLKKGENRWVPIKSTSAFDVAEKKVKSILNKMTKEKFDRLAGQMIDIQILSYEMLQMMIHNVYEKAIQEPTFGDMYADLCIKLSQKATSDEFIHLIESDEDVPLDQPPSVDGTSWRWSNDVSVDDAEVVGPYETVDDCVDVAVEGSDDVDPVKREKTLTLECLKIVQGVFVKVLKDEEEGQYYMVFFPQEEADKSGQQMSDVFGDVEKCKTDAAKQNSFKRTLLNKCEDEFNKQDIYVDWKKEKKDYDKIKSTLTEDERETKKEELDFRRMKIKKQMLGNIKFIGELYKKSMIKENIMHYCINSLLKFEKLKDGRLIDKKNDEMDEEDHEAVCKLFTTIGEKIDKDKNKTQMKSYFKKIVALSQDNTLPSRSRFMYKDLIEVRANKWKLRREQETAKTLQEIKKDFLKEEKQAERESSGYRGGGGGGRGDRNNPRNDYRQSYASGNYQSQSRRKMPVEQSADGFMTVVGKGKSFRQAPQPIQQSLRPQVITKTTPPPVITAPSPPSAPKTPAVPPLDKEKLATMIKSMRQGYIADPTNLEDLTYSMEKFASTPDAPEAVVKENFEFALECNDSNRQGVINLLTTLYDKKYLAKTDFESGCGELIEFIDSFVVDVPFAHRHVAQMFGVFIPKGILSIDWFLEKCSLIYTDKDKKEMIKEVYNGLGSDKKKLFAGKDAAVVAVVGPEAWSEISGN
jgi:translation initiation factor 4G